MRWKSDQRSDAHSMRRILAETEKWRFPHEISASGVDITFCSRRAITAKGSGMASLRRNSAVVGCVQALTSLLEAISVIEGRPIKEATNLMALRGPAGQEILSVFLPLSIREPE